MKKRVGQLFVTRQSHEAPLPRESGGERSLCSIALLFVVGMMSVLSVAGASSAQSGALPSSITMKSVEKQFPEAVRMRYQVTLGEKGMVVGAATQEWQQDGKQYSLHTETETSGLVALFKRIKIVQESEGKIGREGLIPLRYSKHQSGRADSDVRFDWTKGQAVWSDGGEQREHIAVGTQDLLSQMFQAGLFPPDAPIEMTIATGRKVARYAYQRVGEERLQTSAGVFRTLHLKAPDKQKEQVTELWLALDHRNLPVKLRHVDRRGDLYEQVITELKYDNVQLPELPKTSRDTK